MSLFTYQFYIEEKKLDCYYIQKKFVCNEILHTNEKLYVKFYMQT